MPVAQEATVTPQGAMPRLGAIKEKQGMSDLHTAVHPKLDIIDIRRAAVELNLKTEVLSSFHKEDGPRKLPTLLLYDERGLQLFEKVRRSSGPPLWVPASRVACSPHANSSPQITYLDEYYLTNDEIEVLTSDAADIVKGIPSGAMLIELGSGSVICQHSPDAAPGVGSRS